MVIRSARLADTKKIAAAHVASIKGLCSGSYAKKDVGGWISVIDPGIYENAIKEKVMIVAEDKDEILGLGILDIEHGEIGAIYVHPKVKRTGVGSGLLSALEDRASSENVERLTLCSTINARGFYQHYGYVGDDKEFYELPNGVRLECIRMHKALRKG